ncbi:D-aminoacyl-tRNA deacylase [Nannocystis punicea]|uniref:D-aminoacyl-tRNA deacylase n=1 Tax=Nannocystis punicea TaxID=2995304 RepID=A0ABY7HHL4_9BACT|nr:D-aminoacyl-tRNA deacylase [Nannocystis poenicansa]WAS98797.1 D-aminoacyl-tRNA deacylase [Nannocystis poenicansa]
MLTVIQRVSRAAVRVDGEVVGAIERGAMLLVAVERGDVDADASATAKKIASLRFFPGATPMDRTLAEVGGGVLVVSQFTLAGSLRKGRRPSFDGAELPERARALYEAVAEALRAEGLTVATGRFAAHMEVELVNDGPVTFLLRCVAGQVQ